MHQMKNHKEKNGQSRNDHGAGAKRLVAGPSRVPDSLVTGRAGGEVIQSHGYGHYNMDKKYRGESHLSNNQQNAQGGQFMRICVQRMRIRTENLQISEQMNHQKKR